MGKKISQVFSVLLIISTAVSLLEAQVFLDKAKEQNGLPGSYPIHISNILGGKEREVRKYISSHPDAMKSGKLLKTAWPFSVGSAKSWYADNFITNARYLVPSTCRAVGTNCYIFVENSAWGTTVLQDQVDSIRTYFDSKTPANPLRGIFASDTSAFGDPPNVDGDPRIIILLLDIIDGYSGSGGFIGGYFYSFNEVNPSQPGYSTSNFAEIFFIDTNPMDLSAVWGLKEGLSTLAHEFQHMIHFNCDPDENTFINEGCSTLAEVLCGYPIFNPSAYANEPNHYLFDWRGGLNTVQADYSRAARFMVYIYDQAGGSAVKKIVASRLQDQSGINAGLAASGSGLTFDAILHNWFIANILDDRSIDPLYGYIYPNLPKAAGRTFYNLNIPLTTDTVQNYAVQYLSFKNGSNLRVTITRGNPALEIKAVEIGPSSKRILGIASGVEFNEPDFGTAYSEIHFIIMNPDPGTPYTYTYQSFGADTTIELRYDFGEPGGYFALDAGDTTCTWFNAVPGGRLDSIRVAIRRAGTMTGGVWSYSGVSRPSPLGTKLASISASVTSTPAYPYPVPWNNWGSADVRSLDIRTDQPFAVAFLNQGNGTTNPRVMHIESPLPITINSLAYLNSPSSGSPGWYYITTNTSGDSTASWMIRAYISFAPIDTSLHHPANPSGEIPVYYTLEQNFPNPFNPSTKIQFYKRVRSFVTLKVYDIIGREVATLVNSDMDAGSHEVEFKPLNLSSGIYLYRINTGSFTAAKKLVFIR